MKCSYLFLAEGFEEIEALTVVDVLRRAGMEIKTVSISDFYEVVGAHGVEVTADLLFDEGDYSDAEWLVLPGGLPGASNLYECSPLRKLLKKQSEKGKIAAICAAPALVLYPLGILDGKEATCYPGFEKECAKAKMVDARVVALEKIITANGPASAMKFALAIVANSLGEKVAGEVGGGMLA